MICNTYVLFKNTAGNPWDGNEVVEKFVYGVCGKGWVENVGKMLKEWFNVHHF
jgi:hypothetical protein